MGFLDKKRILVTGLLSNRSIAWGIARACAREGAELAFDHWLAASPTQASKLLEFVVERAEERLRRRAEKDIARKTPGRKLRLPGKLADCSSNSPAETELFIVEGEHRLIREQSQWIAPNRLRVVWQQPQVEPKPLPTVETAQALPTVPGLRP